MSKFYSTYNIFILYLQKNQTTSVGLLDFALCQLQEDNKTLRQRVDHLEELLAEARANRFHKSPTGSAFTQASDDDCGLWIIKDPKRIGKLV